MAPQHHSVFEITTCFTNALLFITNIIALKIHSHLFDPREPYHVMHNLSIFNALLKFFDQEYLCAFRMKKFEYGG